MSRITSRNIGDYKITIMNDGGTEFGFDLFPETDEEEIKSLLGNPEQSVLPTRFNVCLIETGKENILVDAGVGSEVFGPAAGHLPEAFEETGIKPEQINKFVISHLHPDHICGSWDNEGNPVFQNAEVILTEEEYNFWTDDSNFDSADESLISWRPLALDFVRIYGDRINTVGTASDISSGVSFHDLTGHTPGHCGIRVESAGEQFLYTSDLLVIQDILLQIPEVSFALDVDREKAAKTRLDCLDMLATDKILFSGGHIRGPRICNVVSSGSGYQLEG